jgi:hypothetical protein
MADTPKVLGQNAPSATTLTALYTVPSGTNTVVSTVSVCNRGGSAATFRISVAPLGAADATSQYLYYEFTVPANDTFVATIGITLAATDVLRIYASNTSLTFNAYGIEAAGTDPVDGWINPVETWTYVSATTFTISGDLTAKYSKGDKIKLTQTTVKYFYVVAISFSTGTTTVTVYAGTDYTLANAAITLNYYSKGVSPNGFPTSFAYSPTFTGFSANPTGLHRFSVFGNVCSVAIRHGTNGTSNSTAFTISLPIVAVTISGMFWRGYAGSVDNGAGVAGASPLTIASAGTTMDVSKDGNAAFTASGGKSITAGHIVYEI